MLTSIFEAVLVMSLVSSVSAGLVFAVRCCLPKYGAIGWKYAAWYIVLIVSMIPVSVNVDNAPSRFGVLSSSYYDYFPQEYIHSEVSDNSCSDSATYDSNESFLSFYDLCALIWLVVVVGRLGFYITTYTLFLKKTLSKSLFEEKINGVKIYRTDGLGSPVALGIVSKKIFLPSEIDSVSKEYVLKHEFMHFRHHDTVYKWLCMAVKCVHWFNPVLYWVSNAVDEECELYCDRAVTLNMAEEAKKEYMNVILKLISSTPKFAATTSMASSKQNIIRRFSVIKRGRSPSGWGKRICAISLLLSVLIVSAVFSAVAGNMAYDDSVPALMFDFSSDISDYPTGKFVFLNLNLHSNDSDSQPAYPDFYDSVYKAEDHKSYEYLYEPKSDVQADAFLNHSVNYASDTDMNHQKDFNTQEMELPNSHYVSENKANVADVPKTDNSDGDASSDSDDGKSIFDMERVFYENDDNRYPYSGSVKYDGLTIDLLKYDIEKSGMTQTASSSPDFKTDYISDKLSYTNGSTAQYSDVSCDESGQVSFYMNSEYDQHIEICFEQNGRQIAGYGIIPDNETTYVFGGFDPEQKYDIRISSSTGSTWKVENNYLVY